MVDFSPPSPEGLSEPEQIECAQEASLTPDAAREPATRPIVRVAPALRRAGGGYFPASVKSARTALLAETVTCLVFSPSFSCHTTSSYRPGGTSVSS